MTEMTSYAVIFLHLSAVFVYLGTVFGEEVGDGGWETQHAIVVDQRCNVERRDASALSQAEFERYFAYSKPLLIENVDNREFRERTSKTALLNEWSHHEVTLNPANTHSYGRFATSFGDYVQNYLKSPSADLLGNETLYLFGDIDNNLWGPLLRLYKLPKWTLKGHQPALSFGIAAAGTGVPFHFHGPVFAEVIYGAKKWFLYPFENRPDFNPDVSTLQYYNEEYPSIALGDRPLECVVRPSQLLYIPDKWWHATLNVETSVFMSTFLSP